MKIGNQIINGFFEYMESIEYTQGDIVLRSFESNGVLYRKLYKVNTNVIGINPELDSSETYYSDYFKSVYSESEILTKSSLVSYLASQFRGLGENGVFTPEEVTEVTISSINTSGIWDLVAQETTVVTYISEPISFMLLFSRINGSISFRYGNTSVTDGKVSIDWSEIHLVSGNVDELISQRMTSLNSLEVLLRDRIAQYDDLIRGLKVD